MTELSEDSPEGQVSLQTFEKVHNPSQVGEFGVTLPEPLKDDFKSRIQNIHTKVQDLWGKEALDAAVTELDSDLGHLEGSTALDLFSHLICLQNLGLLPGYPRYTRTIKDSTTPLPIEDYCSTHPEFKGTVAPNDIEESGYIERHRLYRSKIYSVTDQFWIETNLAKWSSQWSWKTYSSYYFDRSRSGIQTHEMAQETYYQGYEETEFCTTAIFDDSGAHNVAVHETRDWLSTHPQVDATTVPYVVDAPDGIIEIEGNAPTDPSKSPYWMFDIGIFSENNAILLGNIIDDESVDEIVDQINRSLKIGNAALMVLPTRQAVHQFLAKGAEQNRFAKDIAPGTDVVDYYKRQPSLKHVNKELWSQSSDFQNIVFLTRKQILDGFVEPREIIPSTRFESGQ